MAHQQIHFSKVFHSNFWQVSHPSFSPKLQSSVVMCWVYLPCMSGTHLCSNQIRCQTQAGYIYAD
uniref:Uncharacterized protein n=1 Tax=Anguilla anguilla TaxID=7936 RepID=A0A0E9RA23_ANGAN